MKILKREHDSYRLRIECEDDLWALARLCVKGRFFGMLGHRRDQTTGGQEGGRAKVAMRKTMWIKLAIESSQFQLFSENLRVHGIIDEAQIDKGSHHTHIVEPRDEIELFSALGFPKVDHDLVKEACASSGQTKVVIIMVEADEVVLFELSSRGMREVSMWTMRGGGKYDGAKASEGVSKNFFAKIANEITEYLPQNTPMVLAGPGHARERLAPLLEGPKQLISTSMGARAGANEIIREGLAGAVLADHAMVQETILLEEAWKRISTDTAVAYGRTQIEAALEQGAIETLLISADVLREQDWTVITESLSDIGAELVQCSTDHDAGQQLLGMGGAIALLRFKV